MSYADPRKELSKGKAADLMVQMKLKGRKRKESRDAQPMKGSTSPEPIRDISTE